MQRAATAKTALLVVHSNVSRDPRVRRQIDWLASEGWTVDALGLGDRPSAPVRDYFRITEKSRWVQSRIGLAFTHLLPFNARFRFLSTRRFPTEVIRRVRAKSYDLILFNDTHLLPWLGHRRTFPESLGARIHLDLHEYFPPNLPPSTRGRFLLNGYYRWGRSFIAHPLISSRSVAAPMADPYAIEFNISRPVLVRNCPPYIEQDPSPIDPKRIELIHHGVAAWRRGFKEMVDAMRLVDDRFALTFMLAGNKKTIGELKHYCQDQSDRIRFAPAVPMRELAREVNKYDAEVMFFPKSGHHKGYGLPNKLFEAIQGRLAVVIGPTPPMVELVEESGNGIIARDWSPQSLAEAINALTPENISVMKKASHRIAPHHTAEVEKARFFASLNQSANPAH